MNAKLDDYRWLVEGDGSRWLEIASREPLPIHRLTTQLRRELSPERTHLVLQQIDLRARATTKFSEAQRMFFTPKLLEQATGEAIAAHKSARFPKTSEIADLCCGIGGDLIELAQHGRATGIDRDELAVYLAKANCQAVRRNARVRVDDVQQVDVRMFAAIHIDPDRRPHGHRSIRLENHQPNRETLRRLARDARGTAIKLAPATEIQDEWFREAELEWIGERRECQQLVAWFGTLAQHAGSRVATTVLPEGRQSLVGRPRSLAPTASVAEFLAEPHAVVLAADLAGLLAEMHDLSPLTPRGGYLTGSQPIVTPWATCYEVTDVIPYRAKTIRQMLAQRRVGRLTVKKRGVDLQPERVVRECNPRSGDRRAVLFLLPIQRRITAILTHPAVRDTGLAQKN